MGPAASREQTSALIRCDAKAYVLLGATVCLYPHMEAHFRIALEKHQLFIIMELDWLLEKQLEHLNVIQSKTTYSLSKTEAILRKKTFSTKTNKQQTVY